MVQASEERCLVLEDLADHRVSDLRIGGAESAKTIAVNAERLAEELINIAAAPEKWNSMRLSALKESEKYKPDIAARPLIDRING